MALRGCDERPDTLIFGARGVAYVDTRGIFGFAI